jgi:hypothetical protein
LQIRPAIVFDSRATGCASTTGLGKLERRFKDPFPEIGDESLASSTSEHACVVERLRRDVEREPVGQIGAAVRRPADPEPDPVELVVLEHGGLERVGAIGRRGIRREVVLGPQTPLRKLPERLTLREHVLPQLARRCRIGIAACHADDCHAAHRTPARSHGNW